MPSRLVEGLAGAAILGVALCSEAVAVATGVLDEGFKERLFGAAPPPETWGSYLAPARGFEAYAFRRRNLSAKPADSCGVGPRASADSCGIGRQASPSFQRRGSEHERASSRASNLDLGETKPVWADSLRRRGRRVADMATPTRGAVADIATPTRGAVCGHSNANEGRRCGHSNANEGRRGSLSFAGTSCTRSCGASPRTPARARPRGYLALLVAAARRSARTRHRDVREDASRSTPRKRSKTVSGRGFATVCEDEPLRRRSKLVLPTGRGFATVREDEPSRRRSKNGLRRARPPQVPAPRRVPRRLGRFTKREQPPDPRARRHERLLPRGVRLPRLRDVARLGGGRGLDDGGAGREPRDRPSGIHAGPSGFATCRGVVATRLLGISTS